MNDSDLQENCSKKCKLDLPNSVENVNTNDDVSGADSGVGSSTNASCSTLGDTADKIIITVTPQFTCKICDKTFKNNAREVFLAAIVIHHPEGVVFYSQNLKTLPNLSRWIFACTFSTKLVDSLKCQLLEG